MKNNLIYLNYSKGKVAARQKVKRYDKRKNT